MKRLFLSAYLLAHRQFRFSRVETNGFALLLLLLGLILLAPALLKKALPAYNPAPDQQQLDQFAAELTANRAPPRRYPARYARGRAGYGRPAVAQVPLSPFNPNALSATDWEARGVPRYVAARLVRYGAAIGGFQAKAQIQKAYGLDPALYAKLAPFILLPEQLPPRPKPAWATKEKASQPLGAYASSTPASGKHFKRKPAHLQPFDLNAADTAQLQQIRGIGQKTALRLAAYRERLGGFVQPGQLTEVLGFAPDLVDSLRKYTFVRAGYVPEQLAINQASFEELKAHPYVGARLARVIIAYRAQHGPFRQADDLRQIRILEPATLEKLRPYLAVSAP